MKMIIYASNVAPLQKNKYEFYPFHYAITRSIEENRNDNADCSWNDVIIMLIRSFPEATFVNGESDTLLNYAINYNRSPEVIKDLLTLNSSLIAVASKMSRHKRSYITFISDHNRGGE